MSPSIVWPLPPSTSKQSQHHPQDPAPRPPTAQSQARLNVSSSMNSRLRPPDLQRHPSRERRGHTNGELATAQGVITRVVKDAKSGKRVEIAYEELKEAGQGSFGFVKQVRIHGRSGSSFAALKRTRQDRQYKNRELPIMLALEHPNIINLRYYSVEAVQGEDDVVLDLFLDYVPKTIHRVYRDYVKRHIQFPEHLTKLYLYQLFRSISYLHAVGICHRDLKPQNLLTDPETGLLKLIDFGSAKVLKAGHPNVAYTCSRWFRAPELIFGASNYDKSIDLWSCGCILGELLTGAVFFPGASGIDQLVEIIKVLGTPTREQVYKMNPAYCDHKFPQIKPTDLSNRIPTASLQAIDLLGRLLRFNPSERISACEAMTHPFFDDLRKPDHLYLSAKVPPELFDFTALELSVRPELIHRLVPRHKERLVLERSNVDVYNFTPLDLALYQVEID